MENKLTPLEAADLRTKLEEINYKLDNIISLAHVGRSALGNPNAFETMIPEDISETFDLLARNLEGVKNNINDIVYDSPLAG